MIQQANVGVGIFGCEGTQATRSADFCINEFKNLKDLLIFHGAMNYTRTAKLICFCFYKNIILCILGVFGFLRIFVCLGGFLILRVFALVLQKMD